MERILLHYTAYRLGARSGEETGPGMDEGMVRKAQLGSIQPDEYAAAARLAQRVRIYGRGGRGSVLQLEHRIG